MDSAIQCVINRDLVSESVCLYLQFIRTFLWQGFYASWQHENVISCGSLYLRFVPYPHEMRNTMTVHLLEYMNTPKAKPMHIAAQPVDFVQKIAFHICTQL